MVNISHVLVFTLSVHTMQYTHARGTHATYDLPPTPQSSSFSGALTDGVASSPVALLVSMPARLRCRLRARSRRSAPFSTLSKTSPNAAIPQREETRPLGCQRRGVRKGPQGSRLLARGRVRSNG